MTHETKTFRAELKADVEGLKAGEFVALVSMFDNVDMGGDRILKGAFSRTIKEWQAKGDPLPIIWSHEWDNPNAHVGYADPKDIEETDEGLKIKAQLDVDRPFAEQVSHLLKNRRITQFSFGYFAKDFETVEDPEFGKVRELKDVDIFEAGPTLLGMNPATQLLEAASYLRAKATAGEVAEGVMVTFDYDGAIYRGRIEHVMVEGVFGIEGSPFSLEGSADDPALLVRIFEEEDGIMQEKEELVGRRASEVTVYQENSPEDASKSIDAEIKAINVPEYVQENAKRGLELYAAGHGGDGLVDATIRAARQMAAGSVTEEKVRKIGPWIARHIIDLDASKNSDPNDPDYPGAGLVAMLLWGGGSTKEGARRTQAWAEQETAQLEESAKSVDSVTEDEELVTGDTEGTIDVERLMSLVVRTRNNEE